MGETPSGPVSLAIGPLNTAGQAYGWAEAAQRELRVPAISFAGMWRSSRRLTDAPHHSIPHHRLKPQLLRRTVVARLLRPRSHVLSESLSPLLGDPRSERLVDELAELRRLGLVVGAVFHGSDIRDPDRHMARLPYSYFREADEGWRFALGAGAARRRRSVEDLALPAYVSTPDLLADLPGATWLPLIVDATRWAAQRPALDGRKPVVVHLPSRRKPAIKGTSFIDPVLTDFHRRGLIDYRSPGTVPHAQVPALLGGVDIVVEQILTGSYGVAAVEAMSAGRLVIGNVGLETRAAMQEDPPIVDATPDSLADVLAEILDDQGRYGRVAESGPGFVGRLHSGKCSAAVLEPFLQT